MQFTAAFIALVAPAVLAAPQIPGGSHAGVLPFGGRLTIAARVMEEKWQAGCFPWKITATSANGFPVGDSWGLDKITATFGCPGARDGPSHITLTETTWGEFNGQPEIQKMPKGITVPPRGSNLMMLPMGIDLPVAETVFKRTGKKAAIKSVELSWIVSGKTTGEPYYWFILVDNSRVGVGAYTGTLLLQ